MAFINGMNWSINIVVVDILTSTRGSRSGSDSSNLWTRVAEALC